MLVPLLATLLMIPMVSAQNGAEIDVIRYYVVMSPDAQLLAMLEGDGDQLTDLIRTADIETLDSQGFTITSDLGFHMGYIGWNIRDTDTIRGESAWAIENDYEYRTDIDYWPLHDIEFRHALIHGYDQLGIIPPIYGYTVTPVRTLIPPAQSEWYSPEVPEHPFNLGDPFEITALTADAASGQKNVVVADGSIFSGEPTPDTVYIADDSGSEVNVVVSVAGNTLTMKNNLANAYTVAANGFVSMHDHSTCSILRECGGEADTNYDFVDAGTSGSVDDADYWKMPNGDPIPQLTIHTPLLETAPTSYQHGQEFVADLRTVGLADTDPNGHHGLLSVGTDFDYYTKELVDAGLFDGYMLFHGEVVDPDVMYDFCHSNFDVIIDPRGGLDNAPGCHDDDLDAALEVLMFGLNHTEKIEAIQAAQTMLYNVSASNADNFALSRMMLYSRTYFNGFNADMRGIVKSPGHGSDNGWTEIMQHWSGAGRWEDVDGDTVLESVVVYLNGEDPDSLNPTYAQTVYEWNYLDPNYDGLIGENPYNHEDIPWIATKWENTEWHNQGPYNNETWQNSTFWIRDDVYWADGRHYDAYEAEFNLEFIRDWKISLFATTWENLEDVVVHNATHFTVVNRKTSQWLLYSFAGLSALLPPQIWDRDWAATSYGDPIDYPCWTIDYGTDMAPTYSAGPWAASVRVNVFGTGPFIMQKYDTVGKSGDVWKNENYWLTTAELTSLQTEMFHEVGDVNRDGTVNVLDLTLISFSFGYYKGEPEYNVNADLNEDGVVDTRDLATAAFYLGWKKEYP